MSRPKRVSTQTTKRFADRLGDLIEEKKKEGLRQKDIANALGVGSGTLSEWCSDNKTATIDVLPKIADYFDVSIEWLIGCSDVRKREIKTQAIHEETGLSEKTINILTMWKSCKDPMLGYCTDFVDDLLSYDNISSIVWTLRVYRGAVEEGEKEKVAKEYAKVGEILGGSLEDCLKMKNREISEARLSAILEYEQFMNK